VDAGIPATLDLSRTIAEQIERAHGRYNGTSQALNVALGALVAYDTARGQSAFRGIDVERLFSAVEMLADRDNLEITPFVSSWSSALESVGLQGRLPTSYRRSFIEKLDGKYGDSGFDTVFKEGVQSIVGRDSAPFYLRLRREMIAALQGALTIDPTRVDYLAPLLNITGSPLRIATLNYDRAVELLAERAGRSIATGVESWTGGFDWEWGDESDIRLLKLHGSIDWYLTRQQPDGGGLAKDQVIVGSPDSARNTVGAELAVVFGQRGKLRSTGPFLGMLKAFHDFLEETQHLVIVGYSFRDDHINASIRRWINSKPDTEITIIDPAINSTNAFGQHEVPFLQELVRSRADYGPTGPTPLPGLSLLADTARVGLTTAFGPAPSLLQGRTE